MLNTILADRRDARRLEAQLAAARAAAVEASKAERRANELLQLMKHSHEQLGAIVQSMLEINSQSHLVSLNSALEAARAGEHGVGFSVLADEMRRLADRSGEAAKTMTRLIHDSAQWAEECRRLSEEAGKLLERAVAPESAE